MFGFSNHTFKSEVKMRDDWIYLGSYKNHTQYYRKSSVIIDEEKNTINVLIKSVIKTKDIAYLQNIYSSKEPNYIKCKQQNKWYVFNYEKWQFTITSITDYSKSGNVLLETVYQPKWLHNIFPIKWDDIMPGSIVGLSLNKILQDYNILNDFQADAGNNNNYKMPGKSSNMMTFVNSLIKSITKKASYNLFNF
jgi:hypothetical protein